MQSKRKKVDVKTREHLMAQGTAQRSKLPPCGNCKKPFQTGDLILTSVSCGHSFHQRIECVEDLDGYQRFDRVEVFTGGCRLNGCEYDGNLLKNSSEASPTTLLFRNRPLEELVKATSSPTRKSPVVPVVEIPRPSKRGQYTQYTTCSIPESVT